MNTLRPRTWLAIALLAALALANAGCQGLPWVPIGFAPNPTKSDIQVWSTFLPEPAEAAELIIRHGQHKNVYDGRVHTGDTCPFLIYSPKYNNWKAGALGDADWGEFLLHFFRAKHKEEKGCKCDALLGIVKPAPAPAIEPANEAERPPSTPPAASVPPVAPSPAAPPATVPAVPTTPAVDLPDADDLEAKLKAALNDWINKRKSKK
jgi:hypothetical protein